MHELRSRSLWALTLLCNVVLMGGPPGESQIEPPETGVRVVANEAARRVDVFADGKPFTSYIWPGT
ncbi:MAG TPA: hypothetical protein VF747_05480, partial [Blastocatellia bacterium]